MPRFILLQHDYPILHWDFLLELPEFLRSWRFPCVPSKGVAFSAEAIPPHRKLYLDYEGPVSGDRGTVRRIDTGEYRLTADTDELLDAELLGGRLQGQLQLRRQQGNDWKAQWSPHAEEGRHVQPPRTTGNFPENQ